MRFAEPIAALRRILVYLVDSLAEPVTGIVPAGAELMVSKSGAAWATGAGVWTELGLGLYTYEATQAETTTGSYLLVRVAVSGAQIYVYATDIGDRVIATASAAERRHPIYLVDTTGSPATGVDISNVAAVISISLAGAPLAEGAGTLVETGLGAYYYELAQTELVEGAGVLTFASVGVQTYVYAWDVRPAGAAPVITEPILEIPSGLDPTSTPIDHTAIALSRLPHQYRGSNG